MDDGRRKRSVPGWAGTLLLLILDISMIAMEIRVLGHEWRSSGARMLRYYTQSSNLWALLACTVCAAGEIGCLIRRRALPEWLRIVRYVSCCCLMVTMIVAAAVLVPSGTSGSFSSFMLQGFLLYLHTVCPLVMLLGWMLHAGRPLGARHALTAVIPTVIYGTVSLVMNARRVWRGPYFFFEIHRQPASETVFWMIVIIGGNFLLAWLLGKVHWRPRSHSGCEEKKRTAGGGRW